MATAASAAAITATGISVVHTPSGLPPDTEYVARTSGSILFVHGLQGHPQKTWTYRQPPDNQVKPLSPWKKRLRWPRSEAQSTTNQSGAVKVADVFWPRDLLPRQCPNARILTFGYDSKVTKGYTPAGKGSIFSHAKDLLYALDRARVPGRRLVFVAHSLGGIIVKEITKSSVAGKVLRRSELSEENGIRDILDCSAAVIFLGTPHRGSPGLASTADTVRMVAQAILRVDANAAVLRSLGVDSPELEICHQSFMTQWRTRGIRVKTFQEAEAMHGVNFGLMNDKIVPDSSSSLGNPLEHAESIQANHMGMTKFRGYDDPGYQKVGLELSRLVSSNSACINALSYTDRQSRENAIKPPLKDTGSWLLSVGLYVDWVHRNNVDETGGLLWLKGKPGSGKSTLMKEASRRAKGVCHPPPLIATFYFNARGSPLERSPMGLFRSLILQLFMQNDNFQEHVVTHYRNATNRGSMKWNLEVTDLQDLLISGIQEQQKQQRIMIFVDALDECDEESVRAITRYFRTLADSVYAVGKSLNILLSSRHYPTITLARCPEIFVERGNSGDIARYLDKNLSYGIARQEHMLERLRSSLLQRSSGIFLWIVLVVRIVLKDLDDGKTAEEIEETLASVPDDLVELFRNLLGTLTQKERGESLVLVQWVLLSPRTLHPVDIRTIKLLGVETVQSLPEAMEKFKRPENVARDWNADLDRVERNVRTLSRGLMEISGSKVQFIHESVRQFFFQDGPAVFEMPYMIPLGHCMIIRACLHGLCLLEQLYWRRSSEVRTFQWIVAYAEYFIQHHAIEARHDVELPNKLPHILRSLVRVLRSKAQLEDPTLLSNTGAMILVKEWKENLSLPRPSSLLPFDLRLFSLSVSGATLCNNIIRSLRLSSSPCQVSAIASVPRLIASDTNDWDDEKLISSTVVHHPQSHSDLEQGVSALSLLPHLRSHDERRKVAELKFLVQEGSDINAVDSEGNTGLHFAAWKGLADLTLALIAQGARVESCNSFGMTPLLLACLYGKHSLVDQLLRSGANVQFKGNDDYTALHLAAEASDAAMAQQLLSAEADVNAVDAFGRTPLHVAIFYGADLQLLNVLCASGANLFAKDRASFTPLAITVTLEDMLLRYDPRQQGSGSSTNFEKMMVSRVSHREGQGPAGGYLFAPPPPPPAV
ncbi:unnamed protein product [Clonostachys solani]|uniref:Nephrocystin 3-like N-terminal domain-containing protein n=1 Tax=Clonostachys solani TaxID=160281 RepID=A0A9N9ZGT0_9HYPO|nr:unnamed protein product [Clonostachys solani]